MYTPWISRKRVISAFAQVRQEWQEAAGDERLIDVKANPALLLDDLAQAMGLTDLNRYKALGDCSLDALIFTDPPAPGPIKRNLKAEYILEQQFQAYQYGSPWQRDIIRLEGWLALQFISMRAHIFNFRMWVKELLA